jgi:hypothetical protein
VRTSELDECDRILWLILDEIGAPLDVEAEDAPCDGIEGTVGVADGANVEEIEGELVGTHINRRGKGLAC